MSTTLYLECHSHTPPIASEEVGQHLYDLPRIRELLADRKAVSEAVRLDLVDGGSPFDRNTARFISSHPNCDLHIADEYGREHPIAEDGDPT